MIAHAQDVLSVQQKSAVIRLENLIEAFQQGAFSHAVVAQNGKEFPRLQLKAYILQHFLAAMIVIGNMIHFNHFPLPPLNRRYKNSGPPRKEVIAPMGRMMGMIATRANRSPSSSKVAPASTDPGIR